MATPLRISKIDSPLDRRHGEPEVAAPQPSTPVIERDKPEGQRDDEGAGATTGTVGAGVGSMNGARRERRANRRSSARTEAADATTSDTPGRAPGVLPANLWEPPALDEPGELLAARLPKSLVRAMERHTRALRDASGGASQKQLPAHEVLAAVLWALGDPSDAATVERVAYIHRQYRGRRMAAAAEKALASG